MLKIIGYTLLGFIALLYLGAIITGIILAWPFGIIGLIAILGVGSLFLHVLLERFNNKEDDYYDKNVDK